MRDETRRGEGRGEEKRGQLVLWYQLTSSKKQRCLKPPTAACSLAMWPGRNHTFVAGLVLADVSIGTCHSESRFAAQRRVTDIKQRTFPMLSVLSWSCPTIVKFTGKVKTNKSSSDPAECETTAKARKPVRDIDQNMLLEQSCSCVTKIEKKNVLPLCLIKGVCGKYSGKYLLTKQPIYFLFTPTSACPERMNSLVMFVLRWVRMDWKHF